MARIPVGTRIVIATITDSNLTVTAITPFVVVNHSLVTSTIEIYTVAPVTTTINDTTNPSNCYLYATSAAYATQHADSIYHCGSSPILWHIKPSGSVSPTSLHGATDHTPGVLTIQLPHQSSLCPEGEPN